MGTFAELLLPLGISVDRDEVEERLVSAFSERAEVTGAGTGPHGSNLDIEFFGEEMEDDIAVEIGRVLSSLALGGARVRFQGADAWISL